MEAQEARGGLLPFHVKLLLNYGDQVRQPRAFRQGDFWWPSTSLGKVTGNVPTLEHEQPIGADGGAGAVRVVSLLRVMGSKPLPIPA